jgi:hypothetical protein
MLRRGLLRPQADDEDGHEGPTEEKRVYNRGERREHDAEWEEPLLKRIWHLKEMTMRAEAARAGKRLKHAVTALFVMSYETGQKNLYRTLAPMTDRQLLTALAAGSVELSINGATPPTPQPAHTHPATPRENLPSQPTQQVSPPSQPEREASPLQQQQQASPLDRQQGGGTKERARQEQQHDDSRAQPGSSGYNQPSVDQPPAGAPQAQLPTAQPEPTTNQKKTCQSRKKAFKRYWARKFRKGE